ncbi:MAG: hypothetical protein ACLR2E_19515 [Lachnospiraceae bacterium]
MIMKIHGFQTLTLLDYPGYTAATIFLGGCNFRCPFCQNAGLVLRPDEEPVIPEDDVLAFLKKGGGCWTASVSPAANPPWNRSFRS